MLVARAAEARDVLPEWLRDRGAEVDVVALYETVREEPDEAALARRRERRLRHLHLVVDRHATWSQAVGDRFPRAARVVSIGPITSETAREAGLEVHVEAERHDIEGSSRHWSATSRRTSAATFAD